MSGVCGTYQERMRRAIEIDGGLDGGGAGIAKQKSVFLLNHDGRATGAGDGTIEASTGAVRPGPSGVPRVFACYRGSSGCGRARERRLLSTCSWCSLNESRTRGSRLSEANGGGDKPSELESEVAAKEVAAEPSEVADPPEQVAAHIPADILARYEVHSYRNAALILSKAHEAEFNELMQALRDFSITTTQIRTAGGNESDIPKLLSKALRPSGWRETIVKGDLVVKRLWRGPVRITKTGRPLMGNLKEEKVRPNFLDGHKIDYVKGKVAFDLEWNSKDQTFDRDLYAFSAFATCGVVDVAVLVTRGISLDRVIDRIGPALKKDGSVEMKGGKERKTADKYGASTTWMGKLLYRLNAGRNGACPVLAIGIGPACVSDWSDDDEASASPPL